jgi:malonate transporter
VLINTILSALLPLVVTFLLGFVAAWRHDFGPREASVLNRMVLVYAVPLALFAGTVTTSRRELGQDLPLIFALGVAIMGLFAIVLLVCHFLIRLPMSASALAALTASAPAVPFVGPSVLGELFGRTSAIPIAAGSLIINLTVVPVTILLLALGTDGRHAAPAATPQHSLFLTKLRETAQEPIVWAPVLAFIMVLCGVHVPQVIVHSVSLLGHASGGVAMFASGIVLASGRITTTPSVVSLVFLKNIAQPLFVFVGLRSLGYGNPVLSEAVLTTAVPTMPIVILFALQYHVRETETASAVFLSVIASVVTMGMFIALTS